jgi:type I restriction enzyme S subunit
MRKYKKIPVIRFKGFEEEWVEKMLGEVADFNPKSELPSNFEYVDLESVVGTKMLYHRTETKNLAPSRAQRLAQNGDLFYQTVRPYQKNNFLFELPFEDYVFSTGYAQLRPKIDGHLLLNIVQRNSFVKDVLNNCTGTSYPAINSTSLSLIKVSIPSNEVEQLEIGNYFKVLNDLIQLQEQKLEKLANLKKAMLEKMYPKENAEVPELRFKEFTDKWEKKKLGEVVVDLYSGQTPSRMVENFWHGNINWLSSGELNRGVVRDTVEKITLSGKKSANLRIVPAGTFVLAITGLEAVGTRGNCGILGIDTTMNQSCMAIYPNSSKLNTSFLFQWYRRFSEEIGIKYTQGTKQQSFNIAIIKNLEITLPKIEEQEKVSNYLNNIDQLVNQYQQKITQLRHLKKALLQKMFI